MIRVLLKGPILSKSGYGEHARLVYRALKSRPDQFDIYVVPIEWGVSNWPIDTNDPETKGILECMNKMAHVGGKFDISLQVTVPTEWQNHATINIGVTAGIETDKASPEWIQACNQVDKIIVVSEHAKCSLNTSYPFEDKKTGETGIVRLETPIDVIGYPVKEKKVVDLNLDLKTKFNFLAIAQISPRKDVGTLVKNFIEEFHDNDDVGLLLKFHTGNHSIIDDEMTTKKISSWCGKYPDRKCQVYLVHGNLSEDELHSLYKIPSVKSYITTTHGEGYGLPIFEAAYSGLPVVAPAWSGQNDFLYAPVKNPTSGRVKKAPLFTKIKYDLKPVEEAAVWDGVINRGTKWAYVDVEAYKKSLRSTYEALGAKRSMAKQLQEYLKVEFSEEKIYQKYVDAILEMDSTSEEIDELFSQLDI
jgi:glycosyltransferase involved in cell wall biosynthesis